MSRTYTVKEIFFSIQGEGAHGGRPAVFCRFSGCNLWSGREEDRSSAICNFCDTDFVGVNADGGKFRDPRHLAAAVERMWPDGQPGRYVVCTGGEPLLQLDSEVVDALHDLDFEVALETNGTLPAPPNIDWICVSPKNGAGLVQRSGDELKLVYPQPGMDPKDFEHLQFKHFYLQPMDGPTQLENTAQVVDYCERNPLWEISLQVQKLIGVR